MEYKFKTYYRGELVDCEISTFENLIVIAKGDFFQSIGRYKNEKILDGGLPLLPLYEFTGKLDKHGNGIYRGHRLRINLLDMICTVVWNKKRSGFYVRYQSESGKAILKRFESVHCESHKCEIVGHIAQGEIA